jgi:ribosomal protein S18 acetylase RimI-like enzyme
MAEPFGLRPIQDSDHPFLCEVYASTRMDELRTVPWTMAERDAFLRMQFNAQHKHYQVHFPNAEYSIILIGNLPAGRLYLDRSDAEFRIIDIALLPAFRRRGIGGNIISTILAQASAAGKTVSIHVERFNPALRLYQRLGFKVVEEGPIYLFMQVHPDPHVGFPKTEK